jgi:hypothetical protein
MISIFSRRSCYKAATTKISFLSPSTSLSTFSSRRRRFFSTQQEQSSSQSSSQSSQQIPHYRDPTRRNVITLVALSGLVYAIYLRSISAISQNDFGNINAKGEIKGQPGSNPEDDDDDAAELRAAAAKKAAAAAAKK